MKYLILASLPLSTLSFGDVDLSHSFKMKYCDASGAPFIAHECTCTDSVLGAGLNSMSQEVCGEGPERR